MPTCFHQWLHSTFLALLRGELRQLWAHFPADFCLSHLLLGGGREDLET